LVAKLLKFFATLFIIFELPT